ncbi:hypothetical protein ACFLY0_01025, partial [Patescibacteria group bacterium]
SNEAAVVAVDPPTGSAFISWLTNYDSTSQVVYGLTSEGPYTIDLNDPTGKFGYPMANVEDPTMVREHFMTLTDLIIGETYSYRVVSHASPPTVSYEHTFTVAYEDGGGDDGGGTPPDGGGDGGGDTPPEDGMGGSLEDLFYEGGGDGSEGSGTGTSTAISEEEDGGIASVAKGIQNAAAAVFTLPGSFGEAGECGFKFLIIIIVILILQRVWERATRRQDEFKDVKQTLLFWIIATIIATIVIYLFGLSCTILPLLVLLAVLVIWYAIKWYRDRQNQVN